MIARKELRREGKCACVENGRNRSDGLRRRKWRLGSSASPCARPRPSDYVAARHQPWQPNASSSSSFRSLHFRFGSLPSHQGGINCQRLKMSSEARRVRRQIPSELLARRNQLLLRLFRQRGSSGPLRVPPGSGGSRFLVPVLVEQGPEAPPFCLGDHRPGRLRRRPRSSHHPPPDAPRLRFPDETIDQLPGNDAARFLYDHAFAMYPC